MRLTTRYLLSGILAFTLAAEASAQWQIQQTYPSVPVQQPLGFGSPWFQDPNIRLALGIDDRQLSRLNDAYNRVLVRYQDDLSRLSRPNTRQQASQMSDLSQRYATEWRRAASGIFTPAQMTRWAQLEVQARGWNAFSDPEVRRSLNLTDEQVLRLQEMGARADSIVYELGQASLSNPDLALRQYSDFRTRSWEQVNSLLNPQQRQAWANLVGGRYAFPAPFAGP